MPAYESNLDVYNPSSLPEGIGDEKVGAWVHPQATLTDKDKKRRVKEEESTRYLAGRRPRGKEHIVEAELTLDVVHRRRQDLYTRAGVIARSSVLCLAYLDECYALPYRSQWHSTHSTYPRVF
jgi:hypothetical protein